MKKFLTFTMILLVAAASVACDPTRKDKDIIDSMDPMEPAIVALSQAIKTICHTNGSLVTALNFNEYFEAPEDMKEEIRANYYFSGKDIYYQEEMSAWVVLYDGLEIYRNFGGKGLSEAGAEWCVLQHDKFFSTPTKESTTNLILRTTSTNNFTVTATDLKISLGRPYGGLSSYIAWGQRDGFSAVVTEGNYTVRTIGSSPLQVEEEFAIEIEGEGLFWDATGAYYSVEWEILDPLCLDVYVDGVIRSNITGKLAMVIRTSPTTSEYIEAEMRENGTICLSYEAGDKHFSDVVYIW